MAKNDSPGKKPLWLAIEEHISGLAPQDLSEENLEASIQRIASELDNEGYQVSRYGGRMLQVRWAIDETRKVGRPFMQDFNTAIEALTLEDVADTYSAVDKLIREIGSNWPEIKKSERRTDVIRIMEKRKLDLLIAKAKSLAGDEGIRLLIQEKVAPEVITSALDITGEKLKQVNADMEKERAERARVAALLKSVEGKSRKEKIKYLFENDVSEKLMIEMAQVDQDTINEVKQAMEAEQREQQRLKEEVAAKKRQEAEGPPLEEITPDEMLQHIEAIREIMEFSDKENEIRTMCEQSAIPKSLVDVAVSEPERLDELEKRAQG